MAAANAIDRAFVAAERWLDAPLGARANPLRNLGTLAFFLFWVLAATGIYLFIYFDTSVEGAYASIEALSVEQWWAGGVLRSVHRYAADAFVAATLLHLLREWAAGRFRRFRRFSWISGVPLLWLMYASGVVGYWLVWDARAQISALATAEWFDAIGLTAEPMARNFLGAESVGDRLFSLFVFLHIGLPLALLAGMWIHVQRIGQPKTIAPRGLVAATLAMLLAAALARPALSQAPWDPLRLPSTIELDWFLLFMHPLMAATSPAFLWILTAGTTLLLIALPLLLPGPKPVAAVVDPANCNGCARCTVDCPYQAVLLIPAPNVRTGRQVEVMPERCAACGLCAGACPSSTPFRSTEALAAGIDMPDADVQQQRLRLEAALARIAAAAQGRILVFACARAAQAASLEDARTALLDMRCIGMLPPSFIEYALRSGADGALLVACREGECAYRLGAELTAQRLAGERQPILRQSVPRERLRMVELAAGEEAGLVTARDALRATLEAMGPAPLPRPKRETPGRVHAGA
ncbi:MAG TPA: cytochrome b N-terminal domain-containing protein [Burkholderiales bacterium]|nr:cytochrome b N-terminal domain-containing protein [Burkholderiales bacterium]